MMPEKIAPEILRELIDYHPETGRMFWRVRASHFFTSAVRARQWNTRYAGKSAFENVDRGGYLRGTILNREMFAHRVAWAVFYCHWPMGDIDHLDHDRKNNRITNLRDVSRIENCRNKKAPDGKIAPFGVRFRKSERRWYVTIGDGQKTKHVGIFDDLECAIAARRDAEAHFGYSEYHGR